MNQTQAATSPISYTLALRPSPSRVHAAAAWWIPGDSIETWIEEIAGWGIEMDMIALYVLPSAQGDHHAGGVLVVPPPGAAPAVSARAHAYGRLAGAVYIPADAVFTPAVSDEELLTALSWHTAVLHPSVGLVGFEQIDMLHIGDLIAPPPRRIGQWGAAIPGVSVCPRLSSVEPEEQPTLETIVDQSQDDIGQESPAEAPPSPEESPLRNAAASMGLMLSNLFTKLPGGRKIGSRPAGGASPPARMDKGVFPGLRGWVRARQRRITAALEAARERELRRLMNLLASDPDQGLRYAIPLAGSQGRGLADPSGQLGTRSTEFNLGSLGGGQPADPWSMSTDIRQRLTAQYRDAASRELQLGRHRRAAYIFAKLLGDYDAAANALKQGRHCREAAILYRDRLNNPAAAALCLEEGGLLTEAAEIYLSLKQFEKSGDLLARIERPDEAADCYRKAVAQSLVNLDRLQAAKILETKLAAEGESLEVLIAGWPYSAQAAACLRAYFKLLGRTGRHTEAGHRLAVLLRESGADVVVTLAETLATVATTYPNSPVRVKAADVTRVLCGNRLREAGEIESAALVNVVVRLCAQDRLLARDGSRFIAARKTPVKPLAVARPTGKSSEPKLLRAFHLGADVVWKQAIAHDGQLYAIGARDRHAVFVRGQWDGATERVEATDTFAHRADLWMEMLPERNQLAVNLRRRNQDPLNLPQTARSSPLAIGMPDFLSIATTRCVSRDDLGVLWALQNAHGDDLGGVLNAFNVRTGSVISSQHAGLQLGDQAVPFIVAGEGYAVIGLDRGITWIAAKQPSSEPRMTRLPAPLTGLCITFPMTQVRVVATCTEGGLIVWPQTGETVRLADGLFDTRAAFTRSGDLIVAGRAEGRIYRTTGDHAVSRTGGFATHSDAPPLAVLPAARLSEFALISMEGSVRVFSA